jgi:peptide deformylase
MSTEIEKITIDIKKLAINMISLCKKEKGLGLAAPQVGHNIRLVVVLVNGKGTAMINPRIIQASDETSKDTEGCLSCPGVEVSVERPERIVVEAMNLKGEVNQAPCSGLLARCIQHEIDHLDGILIIDYEESIC